MLTFDEVFDVLKAFNPRQPRWPAGSKNGLGGRWRPENYPDVVRGHAVYADPKFRLERVKERAYTPGQEPVKLRRKPTVHETDFIAMQSVLAYLHQLGDDGAVALHARFNNFPVDIYAPKSGRVIEVKGGLVSNGRSARHWRVTNGEPSPNEKIAISKMSPAKKRAYHARKIEIVMGFKRNVARAVSRQTGIKFRPTTFGVTINPQKKIVDIHLIEGFHAYIGWNTELAQNGYIGSFRYSRKS